jgi:uncharacterized RDD family membrane protein YckC
MEEDAAWFYAKQRERFGPVSRTELQTLLLTKQVSGREFIWRKGMPNWLRAIESPEFQSLFSPETGRLRIDELQDVGGSLGRFGSLAKESMGSAVFEPEKSEPAPLDRTHYATFTARLFALMIDSFLMLGVHVVIVILWYNMDTTEIPEGKGFQSFMTRMAILRNISILPYYTILEGSVWQGTIGKIVMGIKVADTDGNTVGFLQAFLRTIGKLLSGLICLGGYIMAGFTKRNQGLHDMIAGTIVVDR